MKHSSTKALIIATIIYLALLLTGYGLYTLTPSPSKETQINTTQIPITLAMFQATTPTPSPKNLSSQPAPTSPPNPVKKESPPPVAVNSPSQITKQPTPPSPSKSPKNPPSITPQPTLDEKKSQPVPSKKPQHQPINPAATSVAEPPSSSLPSSTPSASTLKTAPTITASHPTTQVNLAKQKQMEQRYLSELNAQIARHAQNTYPKRAKRRRWEGEVLIQFTLLPNGNIQNIHIVQPSGRRLLDEAALHIFNTQMNRQFKPFPAEITRSKWVIKVPVSYTLTY